MRKTFKVSKKMLSAFLAVLMVLTSVPLVMVSASNESGTFNTTDHVTIATEARKNEKGADYFANTVWASSDGSANNTSVGILKYTVPSNAPYGDVKFTADFLMQADPNGLINRDAVVKIYYATKNLTYGFPGESGTKVNWTGFGTIIGNTIVEGQQNHSNVVNTYGGASIGQVTLSDLESTQKTVSIDVTDAVNYARENLNNELLIFFVMNMNYAGNNTKGWSDTGIGSASTIRWSTEGNTSNTGTPIDNIDADKLNTDITANNHGKFEHDDSFVTDEYYNQVYKNVLWMTPIVYQANPTADSGVVTLNSDSRGGYTATQDTWYNATTVFLYDGQNEMRTAVMMRSDASYSSGVVWDDQTSRLYSSYISSPSSFSFLEKWMGIDGRLNFQYTYFSSAKGYQILNTRAQTSATAYENGSAYKIGINDTDMVFLANLMKVNYTMPDTELTKTFNVTFAADHSVSKAADRDNCFTTVAATSNAPIYLINYVPLRNAIAEAKTKYNNYVAEITQYPDKYTTESIRAFANAVNALTATKPDNYNYSGNTATSVESYATTTAAALAAWEDAKELELTEYDVTFNLVNRDPVTVKYSWGTTPAVGDGKVPVYVQQKNDTQHTTGNSWSPAFTAVTSTSVKTYNESLTWTNHSYDTTEMIYESTCTVAGQNKHICSCGATYTSDRALLSHTESEWIIDRNATCSTAGSKHKECTVCHTVLRTEAIGITSHNFVATSTVVAPNCTERGYTVYKCSTCNATENRDFVDATGHGNYFYDMAEPATCTKPGYTGDKTCGNVDCPSRLIEKGTSIPATGHGTIEAGTAEYQDYLAPTCGTAGATGALFCKQCNKVVSVSTEIPATGEHTYEWIIDADETCGTDGVKHEKCKNCTATRSENTVIPATGEHTYEWIIDADATCGTAGSKHEKCTACDATRNENTAIPATGEHTGGTPTCTSQAICTNCNEAYGGYAAHTEGEWVATTPAECLKDGIKTLYCAECNTAMGTATISYEGHQFVGDAVPNNNGTHSYKCTGCDLVGNGTGIYGAVVNDYADCVYTDRYEDKDDTNHKAYCVCGQSAEAEHTWKGTSSTEPTCGTQGETNYECELCSGTKTEYEQATGAHTGGTPTCTAQAVCAECNQPYGDRAAHTEQTVTGAPATCLAPGLTDGKKCSVCDFVITAQETIPSPGHSYSGAYSFDAATKTHKQLCVNGCNKYGESVDCSMERIDYNAPSHTATGNASYKCTVCNGEYGEVLAVVPHTFPDPTMENLVRPTEDTDGYFLVNCECGEPKKIPVERADYEAYNNAVENLRALLNEDITPAAEIAINKALEDNEVDTNLITSENESFNEQPIIDAATRALELAFTNNSGNIQTYTVRFYVDGVLVKTQNNILKNGAATAPEGTFEKADDETYHYVYSGWDKAFDDITESIDVNAVFTSYAHTPETIDGYAAECLRDGLTDGSKCSVCERILVAQTAIPAPGHDYEWIIDTGATCGTDGVKHEECTECHDKQNENTAIEATGAHEYEWIIDDEPTCGEAGKKHEKCKNCTATRSENTAIEATGAHEYEWIIDDEPTCGEAGKKHEKCKNCTATRNENTAIEATGNHDYATNVTAPTCTEGGYTTYTCNNCTDSYTDDEVDAKGHDYKWIIDTGATCGTSGIKHEECTVCHDKQNENTAIEATGNHDYATNVTAPTCTEGGYTTYTCNNCTDSYTDDEVDAKGHTEEIVNGYGASCLTNGLTDGKKCSVCGITLKAQETILAPGHTIVNVGAQAPDCDSVGWNDYEYCSVCDYSTYVELPIAHIAGTAQIENTVEPTCKTSGSYDEVVRCTECSSVISSKHVVTDPDLTKHQYREFDGTPATCTQSGLSGYKHCLLCGDKTVQTTIPATGHNWGDWTMTSPATCMEYEKQTRECAVCHKTEDREYTLSGLGAHSYENVSGKGATCTEAGYTAHQKCSVCNDVIGYSVIAASGHTWGEWTQYEPKTCTSYETLVRSCSVCTAKEYKDNVDGGFAQHSYKPVEGKDATCDNAGYSAHEACEACGITSGYEEIPASGHNDADADGLCDHCSHDLNTPGADGCICHKDNIFSKIVRFIYTVFSKLFRKRITCCEDMEYYGSISGMT